MNWEMCVCWECAWTTNMGSRGCQPAFDTVPARAGCTFCGVCINSILGLFVQCFVTYLHKTSWFELREVWRWNRGSKKNILICNNYGQNSGPAWLHKSQLQCGFAGIPTLRLEPVAISPVGDMTTARSWNRQCQEVFIASAMHAIRPCDACSLDALRLGRMLDGHLWEQIWFSYASSSTKQKLRTGLVSVALVLLVMGFLWFVLRKRSVVGEHSQSACTLGAEQMRQTFSSSPMASTKAANRATKSHNEQSQLSKSFFGMVDLKANSLRYNWAG